MKTIRKVIAAALCTALLALCGCSADGNRSSSSSSGVVPYSDDESTTASAFEIPDETKNSETPYLTFLGTGDICPAVLDTYAKTVGLSSAQSPVTVINAADSLYESRLSGLISADESPDLTEKRQNTFPLLMSKNTYEDLTPYMDAAAPQWEGFAEYIDYYSFKGAHYFYPTSVTASPQFLLYDKLRYVQFNIPDPEKLWEKGEWTWEQFSDGAHTLDVNIGLGSLIYGPDIAENFLATTGTAFIGRDDGGKFASCFISPNIFEVREFFRGNYCHQRNTDDTQSLRISQAAFMSTDEKTLGQLRINCPGFSVGIVPYPRADNADKYYCKAVSDGFLVPKGAKNVRSAASFINCSRIAETSEDSLKAWRKEMKALGLLVSDIEWLETIRSDENTELVLVEGDCLGSEANAVINAILDDIPDVIASNYSEPDFNIAAIDADLERINAMI